jgi:putative selenate reductase
VSVKEQAFADDLQFDRGVELIDELNAYAADRGRRFGIKLTNTLVVDNTRGFMPDETMYLSGAPLHVLASTLLERLAESLPGRFAIPGHDGDIMVSFSAGITKENLADSLAMGVNPATICSDLLKPGGYGRLAPMLRSLATTVRDEGCRDLATWKAQRQQVAEAAGHGDSCSHHVAHIRGEGVGEYHLDGNSKLPREVDSDLEMFGCVACNFCVTVCPNDAFTSIRSLEGMDARQQYLVFSELCNECGNCMVFCPERGDPAEIKPRLYTDRALYESRAGQGFLVSEGRVIAARADDAAVDLVQRLLAREVGNPLG